MNIEGFIDLVNSVEGERASLLDEDVFNHLTNAQLISLAKLFRDHSDQIEIQKRDDYDYGHEDGYKEGYDEGKRVTEDEYENRFEAILKRTYNQGLEDGKVDLVKTDD